MHYLQQSDLMTVDEKLIKTQLKRTLSQLHLNPSRAAKNDANFSAAFFVWYVLF